MAKQQEKAKIEKAERERKKAEEQAEQARKEKEKQKLEEQRQFLIEQFEVLSPKQQENVINEIFEQVGKGAFKQIFQTARQQGTVHIDARFVKNFYNYFQPMMWVGYVIDLIKPPCISICKMARQWFITVLIMSHLLIVLLNKLLSLLKHKLLLVVI
nr:hypothetical protein [Neisseria meningitidis]